MHARNSSPARGGGMDRLGHGFRRKLVFLVSQDLIEIAGQHLAKELALIKEAVHGRDEDQLGCFESIRDSHRDVIRIHPIGFSVPIKAERRHHGDDALDQERLEELDIDALHFPRKKMIDPVDDAQGVGDDGIGAGGAQVVGGKALQDLMRQAVGRRQGELQSLRVRDSRAIQVGGLDFLLLGQRFDLTGGAVDDDHPDV